MDESLIPLVDEGLGNSAHLFDLGDGRALAVGPSLDLRAADAAATGHGLRIAYAAETHLHADFLSGARRLAHHHGTRILASAAGHVPGSVAIPLRAQYATWLGWLIPPGVPIIIVRDPGQDPADILWPALNVGRTTIAGELAGGLAAWSASGGQVATARIVAAAQMDAATVVEATGRALNTGR